MDPARIASVVLCLCTPIVATAVESGSPHWLPAYFEQAGGAGTGQAFIGHAPGFRVLLQRGGVAEYSLSSGGRVSTVRMEPLGGSAVRALGDLRVPALARRYGPGTRLRQMAYWSRLRYARLYPGIDLVFRAHGAAIEFQFHLSRSADPGRIRLRLRGATALRLDGSGNLVVTTALGTLHCRRPYAWQGKDQRAVPVDFDLSDGVLGFRLGEYDRSEPLIIDPVVTFSTFLGGSGFDAVYAAAVDSSGDIYLTGETGSTDFFTASASANRDVFVCKLSRDGATLLYLTILSGAADDFGQAIAIDGSGNAVVAGVTKGGGFPVTAGAFQTSHNGLEDGFIVRLNAAGALVYSTYMGHGGTDVVTGVAVDGAGNVHATGYTSSLLFPTTTGSPQQSHRGGFYDAFIVRLSAAGALEYSTFLGGAGIDLGRAISLTDTGNTCVAGYTESPDLPLTNSLHGRVGGGDAFVTCLTAAGTSWLYSRYLGGSGPDEALGISSDSSGQLWICGWTGSATFPVTVGAFQVSRKGDGDAFAAKLDAAGELLHATLLGGSGSEACSALSVDSRGRVWLAGFTSSADFPVINSLNGVAGGGFDAFAAVLASSGTVLYSSSFGGGADDRAQAVAGAGASSAVIAGFTASAGFPTTSATVQPDPQPAYNGMVWKIELGPGPGDYDRDGSPDVIWQHDGTRQVTVNYFGGSQGNTLLGWDWMYEAAVPGWRVAASADFNGDGTPDLVWQNDATRQATLNYFGGPHGNTLLDWAWLFGEPMAGWKIAAAADFNDDGKTDVVWQNDSTRQATVNYLGGPRGNTFLGWNWLYAGPVPGWRIVAAGDFNGDGKPDIVWQNESTRQATVNYLGGAQGNSFLGWNWLYGNPVPGWNIVGANDLNADGKPDIIWQCETTRQVTVNYFGGPQGTTFVGWSWLYSSPVPGWRLIVPN